MRNTKHQIELNTMYNASAISKHLEEMVKKGWMPVKMNSLVWTYKRCEPRDLHFAVTYDKNATEYDPAPSDSQLDYYEFAEHTGWKLACSFGQMQVFYNEQANPIPLETEPEMEVDSIHEAARKTWLPGLAIILLMSILMILMQISSIVNYPISFWSQTTGIVSLCSLILLLVLASVNLSVYFTWHRRALQDAEQGIFRQFPNLGTFNKMILALFAVLFMFWLISLLRFGSFFDTGMAVIALIYAIALCLIFVGIREILKRMHVPAKTTRIIIFILFYVLLLSGSRVVLFGIEAVQDKIEAADTPYDADSMPFAISDLRDVNMDNYRCDVTGTESILLSDKWYDQYIPYDSQRYEDTSDASIVSDEPEISCRVIQVKAPVLYDTVFHSLYTLYDEDANLSYTDETLWGADIALSMQDKTSYYDEEFDEGFDENFNEKFDEEFNDNRDFLLRYHDKFVIVSANWDLTDEQKRVIGEALSVFKER